MNNADANAVKLANNQMAELNGAYRLLLTYIDMLEDEITRIDKLEKVSQEAYEEKKSKFVDKDNEFFSHGIKNWKDTPSQWHPSSIYTFDVDNQNFINALKKYGTCLRVMEIDGENVFDDHMTLDQIQDVVDQKKLKITGDEPEKLLMKLKNVGTSFSSATTSTQTQLIDPSQDQPTALIQKSLTMTITCFSYHSRIETYSQPLLLETL